MTTDERNGWAMSNIHHIDRSIVAAPDDTKGFLGKSVALLQAYLARMRLDRLRRRAFDDLLTKADHRLWIDAGFDESRLDAHLCQRRQREFFERNHR